MPMWWIFSIIRLHSERCSVSRHGNPRAEAGPPQIPSRDHVYQRSGVVVAQNDTGVVEVVNGDADVVNSVDHAFVPRVSGVPKRERRDSSRLECMLSMPTKGIISRARLGMSGLRMTVFICLLSV